MQHGEAVRAVHQLAELLAHAAGGLLALNAMAHRHEEWGAAVHEDVADTGVEVGDAVGADISLATGNTMEGGVVPAAAHRHGGCATT